MEFVKALGVHWHPADKAYPACTQPLARDNLSVYTIVDDDDAVPRRQTFGNVNGGVNVLKALQRGCEHGTTRWKATSGTPTTRESCVDDCQALLSGLQASISQLEHLWWWPSLLLACRVPAVRTGAAEVPIFILLLAHLTTLEELRQ